VRTKRRRGFPKEEEYPLWTKGGKKIATCKKFSRGGTTDPVVGGGRGGVKTNKLDGGKLLKDTTGEKRS